MTDRENNNFKAKLAEQAERYEEMAGFMKDVAESEKVDLTSEERNLLSVAYKNVIGARRAAWRIISSLEGKAETNKELINQYKAKIEGELVSICDEILVLLEDHLIKNATGDDSRVFFHKMKGDYCRYKAEIGKDEEKKLACTKANEAYQAAEKVAMECLQSTDPIRLGLFLNYSVFHYELCSDPTKACKLAKDAFDTAISELDTLNEDKYKDSTLIMQLLRDNLTLWTSDIPGDDDTKVEDLEEDAKK